MRNINSDPLKKGIQMKLRIISTLLAAALADILGTGRTYYSTPEPIELVGDSDDFLPFEKGGMYIDKLPIEAIKRLQFNK